MTNTHSVRCSFHIGVTEDKNPASAWHVIWPLPASLLMSNEVTVTGDVGAYFSSSRFMRATNGY